MKTTTVQHKKQAMVQGGVIIKRVVEKLEQCLYPGTTTKELDTLAAEYIKKEGGELSFNKVPGYRHATCMSVNEVVVHGVPSSYVLCKGDVLKLDIGVYYEGYHVDYGNTYVIGEVPAGELKKFLDIGNQTLSKVLQTVKPHLPIDAVSRIIDENIHGAGYRVIKDLTGHAVGKDLHEAPFIPGVWSGTMRKIPFFEIGKAYALEVIYSMRDEHISSVHNDGWSLQTKTGSQSACFENSVFIDYEKGIVLVN